MCRWVEFAHKSDAKRIATMLNGEPMGMFLRVVLLLTFVFESMGNIARSLQHIGQDVNIIFDIKLVYGMKTRTEAS